MASLPRFRFLEPWRSRVLWLSLAANVFAAALLAAPYVVPRHPPPGPPGFDRIVERMARDLPPDDATRFRAAMERERPWYDMSRGRLDEARAGITAAVGRPEFDPKAAQDAFATMQDRLRESSTRFDESLIAALATVSPEGRAKLASQMGRRRP